MNVTESRRSMQKRNKHLKNYALYEWVGALEMQNDSKSLLFLINDENHDENTDSMRMFVANSTTKRL